MVYQVVVCHTFSRPQPRERVFRRLLRFLAGVGTGSSGAQPEVNLTRARPRRVRLNAGSPEFSAVRSQAQGLTACRGALDETTVENPAAKRPGVAVEPSQDDEFAFPTRRGLLQRVVGHAQFGS
jgi:hypothetical protein